MKKILLLMLLLPLFSWSQENIIPNGSFENYSQSRPDYWTFSRFLNLEKSYDSKTGKYAVKFYLNGGSIALLSKDFKSNVLNVKSNSEYKFSFWHKGGKVSGGGSTAKNLLVRVSWYKDNQLIKTQDMDGEEVYSSKRWQKKELTLTSPLGVNKAGIRFIVKNDSNSYIILDDVSMIFEKKLKEIIPVPSQVRVTPYQREIEIHWAKEADSDIQWEVIVNDTKTYVTENNFFTLDNLKLGQNYQIKLRALKDGVYSEYTEVFNTTTNTLGYSVDSLDRIPYLRTLGADAYIPKTIPLYFTDLANENAEIRYYIDGKEVIPQNHMLTFPELGKHRLKVLIKESLELQWELLYNVKVQNEE